MLVGFAISMQMGLNGNFIAQDMALSGLQQGVLEAVRESCGIFALGVLMLLAGMSEPRIGVLMLVLLAVGLSSYAVVPSFTWLMVASFVWSQGLHVWMPLPNSMALALADPGHEGRSVGGLGAAGAIGSAAALVVALALNYFGVHIRPMWFVAGFAALLGAFACTAIPRNIRAPGARLVIRKKYGLFYLMQFLEGWRKQIFIAFAAYMLVKEHNTPLSTMLALFLGANMISWYAAPKVGRIIDRVGERSVMTFYYSCMVLVFLGYAFVNKPAFLYAMFVADSVLFICTMALTTYIGRIAPPHEQTATLSAGVAANHVASVSMPIAGGLLWSTVGPQWTFLAGAAMALLTLIPVAFLPGRPKAQEGA